MRSGLPKVLHPLADLLAAGSEHVLREAARPAAPAVSIRSRTGTWSTLPLPDSDDRPPRQCGVGWTFALVKEALREVGPLWFLSLRFGVATLFAVPLLLGRPECHYAKAGDPRTVLDAKSPRPPTVDQGATWSRGHVPLPGFSERG